MRQDDIDVFFTGKNLLRKFDECADQFQSDYPHVENPDAIMRGIRDLMQKFSEAVDEEDLKHISIGIWETEDVNVGGKTRKRRVSSDYFLTLDDLEEQYGAPGYAVSEARLADNQVESLSVIEPESVHWSPDTLENTEDETRTKYYLGLIYQICENSDGYDRMLEPELEISPDVLMSYVTGELPEDLQRRAHDLEISQIGQQVDQDAYDDVMAEETQSQTPAYHSIFSYDPGQYDAQVEEETQEQQVAQTARTELPWDEPEQEETVSFSESQIQTPSGEDSVFIDDLGAAFEELDEEALEEMFE